METPKKAHWFGDKTLSVFWLLVFFPVGLWIVWRSNLYEHRMRVIISSIVAVVLLVGAASAMSGIYFLIAWPIALYLLWRHPDVEKKWFYTAAGVFVALFLIEVSSGSSTGGYSSGGSCAAVMTQGNCTYYRDDNCQVIARECR